MRVRCSRALAWLTVTLLLGALTAGCATPPPSRPVPAVASEDIAAAAPAARAVLPLIQIAETLEAGFIEPVEVPRFAEAGLRALLALDPRLGASVQPDRVVVTVAAGPAAAFAIAPPPNRQLRNVGLGAALGHGLTYAHEHSPALAALSWEEVSERLVAGALDSLTPRPELRTQAAHDAFSAIGIEFARYGREVRIVRLLPGSPAARAGLVPGTVLASIDGTALDGLSLEQIVALLRGPLGSEVRLAVQTPDGTAHTHRLRRAPVAVEELELRWLEAGIAYLRPGWLSAQFGDHLSHRLQVLQASGAQPLRAMVLDLRQHTGGVLGAVVAFADRFIDQGLLVAVQGRSPLRFHASPGQGLGDVALVVLVDAGTASGAEVVAAALADHDRAVLIGSRTWGEGSVRTVVPAGQGRALLFVSGRMLRPNGAAIEPDGVTPQLCTGAAPDCRVYPPRPIRAEDDADLQRALELLRAPPVVAGGAR